jgi:tripeptide aminopeptidase
MSPEATDGYDGFVHPYVLQGGSERASVRLIVRDFKTSALKEKEELLERLAMEAASRYGARVEVLIEEQYRNMREVLDHHPHVIEYAREAIRRTGVAVRERPIRGGTDGSKLSFMGLPTPNIFAGEHNFHSRLEWVSVQDMEKAVEVIANLARVWEERS